MVVSLSEDTHGQKQVATLQKVAGPYLASEKATVLIVSGSTGKRHKTKPEPWATHGLDRKLEKTVFSAP